MDEVGKRFAAEIGGWEPKLRKNLIVKERVWIGDIQGGIHGNDWELWSEKRDGRANRRDRRNN